MKNDEDFRLKEQYTAKEIAKIVIEDLNKRACRKFKPLIPKTVRLICLRMKEGFELEDFLDVNKKKIAEWVDDPDMSRYLRPETLYGTKFEGYLNQPMPEREKSLEDIVFGIVGGQKRESE